MASKSDRARHSGEIMQTSGSVGAEQCLRQYQGRTAGYRRGAMLSGLYDRSICLELLIRQLCPIERLNPAD